MKTRIITFLLTILLLSACGTNTTPIPEWPEFTSDIGGFTVRLPSVPEEQVQTVPSEAGDINMYIYMVEKGNAAYGVMFNQMPETVAALTDTESLKLMLDGGRDGALQNIGATLIREEEITLNNHPGRHIVFEISPEVIPGGGKGTLRLYLINGQMYQLIALGGSEALTDEDISAFLDSFTLNP